MNEKILNISIRIADQPRMALRIPASQEEVVRRAEANINELGENGQRWRNSKINPQPRYWQW